MNMRKINPLRIAMPIFAREDSTQDCAKPEQHRDGLFKLLAGAGRILAVGGVSSVCIGLRTPILERHFKHLSRANRLGGS